MAEERGKESGTEARLRVHLLGGVHLEITNVPQADTTLKLDSKAGGENVDGTAILIIRGISC